MLDSTCELPVTYRRFEDLPAWQAAIHLATRIFALAEAGHLGHFSGLRNQLERAVLSISNNIAEGFERGTMAELIAFLYIDRGCAGEVRSMIFLLERLELEEPQDFTDLRLHAIDVSRQLGAWITSLENSHVKGLRSLTKRDKAEHETTRRREEFEDQLRRIQSMGRTGDHRSHDPTSLP